MKFALIRKKIVFSLLLIFTIFYVIFNLYFGVTDDVVKFNHKIYLNFKNLTVENLNKYIQKENKSLIQEKLQFSLNQSDQIGGYREIPDTRQSNCAVKSYDLTQIRPKSVSVIIIYKNEARSTLLRTITSLLVRTPLKYLNEIILIDDFNEDASQSSDLDFLPLLKIVRNTKRKGLIKSRNDGVRISSGDYVVFLDSHCEVNNGWLEPLLARLVSHSSSIAVSPILDSINAQTFQLKGSTTFLKGGFDWNLNFHWIPMSEEEREQRLDPSDPFSSPSFSGGVFMISRQWFLKLNGFNENLEIWGGESIEMAIKLWLCGGRIEIVPCSRIGHVFQHRHSFEFPNGSYSTYLKNSKIIAESWFDEYKYFFYSIKPEAKNSAFSSAVKKYSQLTKLNLQCRPFKWYLKVIFNELKLPNEDYIAFGKISSGHRCLTIATHSISNSFLSSSGKMKINQKFINGKVLMRDCYKNFDDNITNWLLNIDTGKLTTESGACLDYINNEIILQYCKNSTSQQWTRQRGNLIHNVSKYCLENDYSDRLSLNVCRPGAIAQLFSFSIEIQKL